MKRILSLSLLGLAVMLAFGAAKPHLPHPFFSLDSLKLPAGVDPNDENWKGIDLAPKDPIQPLTVAEEAKRFQFSTLRLMECQVSIWHPKS